MGLRLFLAVATPVPLQAALGAFMREARPRATGWRWVEPSLVHLTLRFYGDTDVALVDPLVAALQAVAARETTHSVAVRGWGVFPQPSRPRVLWAGLAGDLEPLERLAAAVEADARGRGFAPEERAFRPHVTLARAARDQRPRLPGTPDPDRPEFGPLPVDELVLYRSHLGPAGPTYEPIARAALAGTAAS